ATGGRAVKKASFDDANAETLFDRRAVENRLQHSAATNQEILVRPVLSGLVVGDSVHVEIRAMFDHVDRSAQDKTAVDRHRRRQTPRIASLVVQAETEFEVLRHPAA